MAQDLVTLKEAAKFLKLSRTLVEEMIDEGVFKSFKKGRTVKVDKNDIQEWLSNLSETEEEQLALQRTFCRFKDYFNPNYITLDFSVENKFEAIAEMSKLAKDNKIVRNQRWLYEVVVAREELVSTAVGHRVALLHPRRLHPSKIKYPSILFGRSIEGVDFDAPDDQTVNLFFMLLLHNDKQHLFSLSYLTKFFMKKENLEFLSKESDPKEIYNKLTKI